MKTSNNGTAKKTSKKKRTPTQVAAERERLRAEAAVFNADAEALNVALDNTAAQDAAEVMQAVTNTDEPAPESDATPAFTPFVPTEPEPVAGTGLRAVMVIYDIPSAAKGDNNPSHIFRRVGFRANLSCWVFPEHCLESLYPTISELRNDAGAAVDIVRFDPTEGPRLVRMAVVNLQKDIEAQTKRTAANVVKAADLCLDEEVADTAERDALQKNYESRASGAIKKLKLIMDDAENAIQGFGVGVDALDTAGARTLYGMMQEKYEFRLKAYADATAALREANTATTNALAAGMAAGTVPTFVAADALRENGQEAAADALTAAVSDETPTGVAAEDDGTFSLAGSDAA